MATLPDFEVYGTNKAALFSLKVYRGEGMALLAMNWGSGTPPDNFVGFAIEYQSPGENQFYPVNNRLSFLENDGNVNPQILSSRLSPIQKFRWVHFPHMPDSSIEGEFIYRVTPVFMDSQHALSYGDFQEASIHLQGETYPGELNIAFTRGFVASQAFADKFQASDQAAPLLPSPKVNGLDFVSTNTNAAAAMDWMGFESREAILKMLDLAIADTSAEVRVTAYDLDVPEVVSRLVSLGGRLKIIIDDSGSHGKAGSPEDKAEQMLIASAGAANVQRQHMGELQHNKTIAIMGDKVNMAIGGSTNFSWRGFFVQNNNAAIVYGAAQVKLFFDAFDNLWANENNATGFGGTASANWTDLQLPNVQAKIAFSPHNTKNACLNDIADDMKTTTSSLLFSLAFLYQTKGVIMDAITEVTDKDGIFVYGISDKGVKGLTLQAPNGNPPVAFPNTLLKNVPEPFKSEVSGGNGIRMHHKFVIIDFDKPGARVYMGSYNFSTSADRKNGENLWVFHDRRVAVSYMIQAVSMFDHYEWRDIQESVSGDHSEKLHLFTPPAGAGDKAWWAPYYSVPEKIHDRELFSA